MGLWLVRVHRRVVDFCQGRPAQCADDFLAHCALPSTIEAREFALTVRDLISTGLGVAPEAVHAADRIPEDLGDIFVRESLDAVGFIMDLEDSLRVRFPDFAVGDLL